MNFSLLFGFSLANESSQSGVGGTQIEGQLGSVLVGTKVIGSETVSETGLSPSGESCRPPRDRNVVMVGSC
jgi:hypothetical protein